MQNPDSFGVIFVLKQQGVRDNIAPVYARTTVNGKRALLSIKRRIQLNNWNPDAGRGKGTSIKVRQLNSYLDQVYRNLLEAHKQLLDEKRVITAQAVKALYLGADDTFKKISDILEYHITHMESVLKPGTLKNYRTTYGKIPQRIC